MDGPGRRILLAVEPGMLEGALARLLTAGSHDEVVQAGRTPRRSVPGHYDAAIVSDQLPVGVQADVVIILPDTRGSGGTGSVSHGENLDQVSIPGAERVLELLEQYAPAR